MASSPLKDAYSVFRRFDSRKHRLDDLTSKLRERDQSSQAIALIDAAARHAMMIDHLISHGSTVKPSKMERAVLAALRLGVSAYARGMAEHAVVNETVELLPKQHRARGIVNAVMRRVTEIVESRELSQEERAQLCEADPSVLETLVTPKALPFAGTHLVSGRFALFPVETKERLGLLAGISSWLIQELSESLEDDELRQMCISCAMPPALWFRILESREKEAAQAFEGLDVEMLEHAVRVSRHDGFKVLRSKAFEEGAITVQDFAAQQVVGRINAQAGWRCLDLCASPGGKACQLADIVGKSGSVFAFDRSEDKLRRIQQNIGRLKLTNVATGFGDGTSVSLEGRGNFDLALVDVPCSNTGVIGRRPDVKLRLKQGDLTELREIQQALLKNAARHVKPGGLVVYSTCSLLDNENGALVRAFLDAEGGDESGWSFIDEDMILPKPGNHDGGYFAILKMPARSSAKARRAD